MFEYPFLLTEHSVSDPGFGLAKVQIVQLQQADREKGQAVAGKNMLVELAPHIHAPVERLGMWQAHIMIVPDQNGCRRQAVVGTRSMSSAGSHGAAVAAGAVAAGVVAGDAASRAGVPQVAVGLYFGIVLGESEPGSADSSSLNSDYQYRELCLAPRSPSLRTVADDSPHGGVGRMDCYCGHIQDELSIHRDSFRRHCSLGCC